MLYTLSSTLALCFIGVATSAPVTSSKMTTRDVWVFPNGTWLENLAVRSSGQILTTVLSSPDLYQVDPTGSHCPTLVHHFPNVLGLLGIAEIRQDVFAVAAGNYSTQTGNTPGTYSLWSVDLSTYGAAATHKIVDIPEAGVLNGVTLLNKDGAVLVADSVAGVVYRVDTKSGKYAVVLQDPTMKPAANQSLQIGVNGIHVRNGNAYFTSSTQGIFARVPIHSDGTAAGPVEIIARNGLDDDFTFDASGNAYVAQNSLNTLAKITPKGVATIVAGNVNSSVIADATAAQFGRGSSDKKVLYLSTGRSFTNGAGQTVVQGGKIVAIEGLTV